MEIEKLIYAKVPTDVVEAWELMWETKVAKCLIVGLYNYEKEVYPENLKEILNSENGFVSYFSTV